MSAKEPELQRIVGGSYSHSRGIVEDVVVEDVVVEEVVVEEVVEYVEVVEEVVVEEVVEAVEVVEEVVVEEVVVEEVVDEELIVEEVDEVDDVVVQSGAGSQKPISTGAVIYIIGCPLFQSTAPLLLTSVTHGYNERVAPIGCMKNVPDQ